MHTKDVANATEIIENLNVGIVNKLLTAAFKETAQNVVHFAKKGKIDLSFQVEQIGDSRQVNIHHTLKYNKPTATGHMVEQTSGTTMMYLNLNGSLSIHSDTQEGLDFEGGASVSPIK